MLHLLAYTTSVLHAASVSYDLPYFGATSSNDRTSRLLRVLVNIVSLAAICYSAIELAGERGRARALVYAIALLVLVYMLPRLLLRFLLQEQCGGCPPNGLMSMAIVMLVLVYMVEQGIRYVL